MTSLPTRKRPPNAIYTRTGDQGYTHLYDGTKLSKSELQFEVLGKLDELNVCLGTVCEYLIQDHRTKIREQIRDIQNKVFWLSSNVATPRSSGNVEKVERTMFPESETLVLEELIDELQEQLPPLKNFIVPGGGIASLAFHQARCKCREVERSLVSLQRAVKDIDKPVLMFINRLSDFLFVCARFVATEEVVYNHAFSKSTNE